MIIPKNENETQQDLEILKVIPRTGKGWGVSYCPGPALDHAAVKSSGTPTAPQDSVLILSSSTHCLFTHIYFHTSKWRQVLCLHLQLRNLFLKCRCLYPPLLSNQQSIDISSLSNSKTEFFTPRLFNLLFYLSCYEVQKCGAIFVFFHIPRSLFYEILGVLFSKYI